MMKNLHEKSSNVGDVRRGIIINIHYIVGHDAQNL
jgi:hypothetical protein